MLLEGEDAVAFDEYMARIKRGEYTEAELRAQAKLIKFLDARKNAKVNAIRDAIPGITDDQIAKLDKIYHEMF